MNRPTLRLSLTFLLLLSVGLTASLRAETVGFPKDKPALTIYVPAGWKVDWEGDSRVQFTTEGGAMKGCPPAPRSVTTRRRNRP
jgi:hypothetical protein